MNKCLNNDDGQTVIEYILLMFVMVIVITTSMGRIQDWFLAGADSCTPANNSFICKMDKTFNQTFNSYGSMRYYVIRR